LSNQSLHIIIDQCREGHAPSQKLLYDKYKSILFGICRRYVGTHEDAEDVLVESFLKIFGKLDEYKGEGSFEGWMKRITVNEALMFLRKRKMYFEEINESIHDRYEEVEEEGDIQEGMILQLIDSLPDGYRAVFNLYVIEEYKHREIADMLGISINTSKSQLILAKKKMQELIKKSGVPSTWKTSKFDT
jgi:RNA polymerase sigma factor (sigma-70 family)